MRPLIVLLAGLAAAAAIAGLPTRRFRSEAAPPRPVANLAFPSPSAQPARALLWAVGDGAAGTAPGHRLAQRIVAEHPTRVLYLGDVYETGTPKEFRSRMRGTYRDVLRRMWPTPGNHEWRKHLRGYDPFWQRVTGHRTPPWYRAHIAGWDVVSLNSQAPHDEHSPQLAWLHRNLRGAGTCRLAFWHRPRWSGGPHGDQADVEPFVRALRGHAALLLGGHDHDLQRFRPRAGLVQVVSGAGGRALNTINRSHPGLAFSDRAHFGGMRLRLSRGLARLEFVRVDGQVVDRSSIRCRPG
jgi:hypothetical protein